MSKQITPIPFRELMRWITAEYQQSGSVFGVAKPFRATPRKLPIFGEYIENDKGEKILDHYECRKNGVLYYTHKSLNSFTL